MRFAHARRRSRPAHAVTSGPVRMGDDGAISTRVSWARVAIASLLLVAVGVAAIAVMLSKVDPSLTDATSDWVVTAAAGSGLDPWSDVLSLSQVTGADLAPIGAAELGDAERVHPRTPGALLLLWPLLWVPASFAYPAAIFLAVAAYLGAAIWLIPAITATPRHSLLPVMILGLGSGAFLTTLEFGSHSGVLMLSIAAMWVMVKRGHESAAGIALGVAITLRLFPVLLLIPLWMYGKRKACYSGVFTFGILNLVGLAQFNLEIGDSIAGLAAAAETWVEFSGNGSLAMPLARLGLDPVVVSILLGVVAIGGSLTLARRSGNVDLAMAGVLVVGVICSPLSWEHYDLLALLAAVVVGPSAYHSVRRLPWRLLMAWATLQLLATPIDLLLATPTFSTAGVVALLGRLLLVVAIVVLVADTRPVDEVRPKALVKHA